MRVEVKAFGKRNATIDSRDRAGKLNFQAEHEGDAAILALLSRVMCEMCCKESKGNRLELYRWLRQRVDDQENFPDV